MANNLNDEKTNPFEKRYLATHHGKKKKLNKRNATLAMAAERRMEKRRGSKGKKTPAELANEKKFHLGSK